jgi:TRAP-type C4-dicarboxylate transport system substrate-binding protein
MRSEVLAAMARLRRRIAAAVAVASALVGCSGPGTKAGGHAELITLRLAAIDSEGAPYTEGLAEFVRQVADRSGGAIHVEISWEPAKREFGESGPRGDQQVAGLVQNRTYELGLIPARSWDMLNVTSLRALQAPFLIDSDQLMDTVATGELVEPMLRSLGKVGVVGLALIPDGLRHPIGFTKPFLNMRDFAGTRFRVLPSDTTNQLIRALGAEPVNLRESEFADGLSNGSIAGAESAFGWAHFLPRQGVLPQTSRCMAGSMFSSRMTRSFNASPSETERS